MVPVGFHIFSGSPADDISLAEAKDYIARQGLTSEDVKIKRSDECFYVVTKKEINLIE